METIRLQNEAFFTFNKRFNALTISGELTGDFILCGVASGNFQTVMCTDTNEMFLIERKATFSRQDIDSVLVELDLIKDDVTNEIDELEEMNKKGTEISESWIDKQWERVHKIQEIRKDINKLRNN
jgi:hypothetical protein